MIIDFNGELISDFLYLFGVKQPSLLTCTCRRVRRKLILVCVFVLEIVFSDSLFYRVSGCVDHRSQEQKTCPMRNNSIPSAMLLKCNSKAMLSYRYVSVLPVCLAPTPRTSCDT